MIPLLNPRTTVAGPGGSIGHDLHLWLQSVKRALHGPFIGEKATGTFSVLDGQYAIHADELILIGSEEVTLHGDAVLVVL